jgi:hypothetical protein
MMFERASSEMYSCKPHIISEYVFRVGGVIALVVVSTTVLCIVGIDYRESQNKIARDSRQSIEDGEVPNALEESILRKGSGLYATSKHIPLSLLRARTRIRRHTTGLGICPRCLLSSRRVWGLYFLLKRS